MGVSEEAISAHRNGNDYSLQQLQASTLRLTSLIPPELKQAEKPEADSRNGFADETKRALGALLIAAPLAPVLAVILSVLSLATWLRSPDTSAGPDLWQAAFINLAIAWLGLAGIAWLLGLSTAKGALPGTYGELVVWLVEIRAWLVHLNTIEYRLPSLFARTALYQLQWHYQLIRADLDENGSRWFVGTGYVNVWRRVHQAQELLVRLVSDDALPAAARGELMRFNGSQIGGRDDAVTQLEAALSVVDSKEVPRSVGALIRLLDQLATQLSDHAFTGPLIAPSTLIRACDEAIDTIDDASGIFQANSLAALRAAIKALSVNIEVVVATRDTDVDKVRTAQASIQAAYKALKPSITATTPTDVEQARDVIQAMRSKVDEYRDKARSGLARARSDVTRTLTIITMLAYALFWIVIEARFGYEVWHQSNGILTPQTSANVAIVEMGTGAIALFLWGALVGLFGQLWLKWNATPDGGEDDFGLDISRAVAEPVLAGVAGMCGVVVFTFGGTLLTSGLAGLAAETATAATTLQNAFLPGSFPASLLYAAIFALSPNLLISRLVQSGASLQQNLSGSSAGDGGGMTNKPAGQK
jgi:hypothetical protein